MKVLHISCTYEKSVLPVLEGNFSVIEEFNRIGLISTAQHLNQLNDVKRILESRGKKAVIGGQVLGCNQSNALNIGPKVDAFLFIGSGLFHPLGIAVKTGKPVYTLNPYSSSIERIPDSEKERWFKRQKGRLMKAIEAETFGVLVSVKAGQYDLEKALQACKKIKSKGKKAFLFSGEELSPNNLLPFKVDCWVNTACPRLADDKFEKTVINAEELDLI